RNQTKVGLKDRTAKDRTNELSRRNQTKVGLKGSKRLHLESHFQLKKSDQGGIESSAP
ncbi:MAG: hypothetical protein OD814_001833, partial [Candidatus Alkanophagales archaeon MCA70_species_1]|nr:hypothetical protein [Candidatus Alkanophaga volatiphilum]